MKLLTTDFNASLTRSMSKLKQPEFKIVSVPELKIWFTLSKRASPFHLDRHFRLETINYKNNIG